MTDWFGDSAKETETFTTDSREWRIYWRTMREVLPGAGIFQVSVHRASDDALVTLAANKQGIGRDVSYVRSPPGRYYLKINSANVYWSVRVEDQRPAAEPAVPPSALETEAESQLADSAKSQAAKRKISEQQARQDIDTVFVGTLMKNGLIKHIGDDFRIIEVDGTVFRQMRPDDNAVTIRRFSELRYYKTREAQVIICDSTTGKELASYSPLQGVRFR